MKILVVGSGGREHAFVDALSQSSKVAKIFAAPGNGGIAEQAELVAIAADDVDKLADFALGQHIDLTLVGPEVPLSKGIVDLFRSRELAIVGPTAGQARLESSKAFAKQFFKANDIPTAAFEECVLRAEAYEAIEKSRFPTCHQADGLAAGKGVVIAQDVQEARRTIEQFMESKTLGDAGSRLVIEEFLEGEEASFHVFADGIDFQPMVAAQDHKRRFDADTGPNTGGMGAYSVDSILTVQQQAAAVGPHHQANTVGRQVIYGHSICGPDAHPRKGLNCSNTTPASAIPKPRSSCLDCNPASSMFSWTWWNTGCRAQARVAT
jgi:phosphoribosylamine--glycine ligase